MFYIGIDGGATKTLIHAASPDGQASFRATDQGTNLYRVSEAEAIHRLNNLIEQAQKAFPNQALGGIGGGFAGAGALEAPNPALEVVKKALQDRFHSPVYLTNDAVIGIEGALAGASGLMAIVGTGSNVVGKTQKGTYVTTGAWGYLLGDEGSGMALGYAGLRALTVAIDEGTETHLRERLAEKFGLKNRAEVLNYVYKSPQPIQNLAPIVLEVAAEGDHSARDLVKTQVEGLSRQIHRLAVRYADQLRPQLAFVGGLYENAYYREAFQTHLSGVLPHWKIVPAVHHPVLGAWQLAINHAL